MTVQKRALTINFQRSVSGGVAQSIEVAIRPLSEPSSPPLDSTLVGGTQVQTVVLSNETNSVVFELVPTDHPDLTERVTYRIAWREKFMGRQFTKDFVMPDFDVAFDDLEDLGNIIGGESYIQWVDRSRAGGVAGLNDAGQVIDADGVPVSGAESAAVVQGHLDAEVVLRQQVDINTRNNLIQYVNDQLAAINIAVAANLNAAVQTLANADLIEKSARQNAVIALNTTISNLQASTTTELGLLQELIDDHATLLTTKADLVGGKIPTAQLPSIALGRAVSVADQAAMLALTSDQVQPGDFAVRPDSVWFLNASPPSTLGNWVQFQTAAAVLSINGHTGAVVLSAADVGARSASVPVPLADVTGLISALAGKAATTVTDGLNTRVNAIENDTTIVKTTGGLIAKALMPADTAFVNLSNLVTKKDGTVLNLGAGGTLDIADVSGLQAALDAKLPANDASVTNARTPTAHKTSHATGQSDALSPSDIGAATASHTHAQSDITGLSAALTSHGNRLSSLETRVTAVEGGGGGGGGSPAKSTWFDAPTAVGADDVSVLLKSPFGHNPLNPNANADGYYYDPAGAADGEWVWPYLTPNGHLKFTLRNESNPADAALATQAALDALTTTVGTKAAQVALDSLTTTVGTKAAQSALDSLSATVDTKASIAALGALSDTVATKASQTALDDLSGVVGTKAAQADLTALTTTVNGKASQADLDTLDARVDVHDTGKADLVTGTVPLAQLPNNIPSSKITGLDSALPNKADLVTGTVPLSQLPSYPTSKVTNLNATLDAKADLVGGFVPSSQLPALSLTTSVPVANRAALLALTSAQVQPGDLGIITDTADKGTYMLMGADPSVWANWRLLPPPDDAVQSINSQTGAVVLGAADVGARSSAVAVPQSEVTGLIASLASKVDTSTYTAGLAGKTAPADVQTLISQAGNKQKVDLVATVAIPSLSGAQSVDGVLATAGTRVLVTAQASSVNNGVWVVATGAWTRAIDMIAGDYFVKGTLLTSGTAGSNNGVQLWEQTNSSGIVGTNANNWSSVGWVQQPPTYTASLGVQKVGNDFRSQIVSGGGINAVSGGLQLDPNVATRKFAGDVPAGSAITTITHNLNTTDIIAWFRDKAAGDSVLVGWKPTGVNTLSVEFATAPSAGQYRVVCVG